MKPFILRNYKIFIISCIVYIIGAILGLFFDDILQLDEPEKDISISTFEYFQHNFKANILISLSIFTFGFFTTAIILANGFIIGASYLHSVAEGYSSLYIILALAPHGIFEIPAMLLASTIGFKFLDAIIKKIKGNKKIFLLKDILALFTLIVILTILAAIVEANITPVLMKKI